ncbi:hypothetical protein A2188_03040 [Candidatus Woesebacteria bacterium RIFOXYA1_FULL_43_9]|uniref:Uncharacterized protein n=1 Tax=Candidatus Woesebacteria bacterium RIFOXYA1_FULL_43_9 TaxID=1802534 RepID=A0A1F8CNF0_9BACT|nr:MAG: hypothetical protein A2188_03040 [Candidatus Woesebacteria bacterium RIFOXYA1_FULL_43_9]
MPKKFKLNRFLLGFFLIFALATALSNLLLTEYHLRLQALLIQQNQQRVLGLQTSQREEEFRFWQKIAQQFPTYKPGVNKSREISTNSQINK